MTPSPARTLVILDFSGTLSIDAVRFGDPERVGAELRRSGLWALGIDSPELFWERLVAPTWQQGSTTNRGYTAVLAAAVFEVLHERGRQAPPDVVRRAVGVFADRYFACSAIAPQWRGYLQRVSGRDDAAVVIATDHYAEATAHIVEELARLGVRGAPVASEESAPSAVAVANSADLGRHKSSAQYWQAIDHVLGSTAVLRVALIDDFGANEAQDDGYADVERVRQRRAATNAVLTSAFGVAPDVYPFVLPGHSTADDVADLVAGAERFTMNVLSRPS